MSRQNRFFVFRDFKRATCGASCQCFAVLLRIARILLVIVWLSTRTINAADREPDAAFRSTPLTVPAGGRAGFTTMPPESTGIRFINLVAESHYGTNQILISCSGVAAGDVDGDGRCDLYFSRINGSNALYRNLGDWRFEDITAAAGVACPNMASSGVALVDLDGDGDLDLVVNSIGHGTRLYLNDGRAHFTELMKDKPLNLGKGGMCLALGDLDGDGFLDLYVSNYRTLALMDMPNARFFFKKRPDGSQYVSSFNGRSGQEPDLVDRFVVSPVGGIDEQGEADGIYRNLGGTNFIPFSFTNGAFLDEDGVPLTRPPFDWGLSVMIRDLNQDGLPDIYVCNDFDSPDRVWLNQGGGKFRAAPRLALRQQCVFSMGLDVADINRDGFDDIFVVDMLSRDHLRRMDFLPHRKAPIPFVGEMDNRPQYSRNVLYLNRGDGTYAEMAAFAGLEATEWSWCPAFLDVDLDGWEDVLVTNGHERDARGMDVLDRIKAMRAAGGLKSAEETFAVRRMFPRLATPNVAFRNNHDLTFKEVGQEWGFNFAGVSHGLVLADLDNDGDLDVVINNFNDPPTLLRNNSSAPRVAVKLKGRAPNTAGIGAKIKVSGGPVTQQQEMIAGGRYLASDQAMRVFAAGSATNSLTIEVNWRSGRRSVVNGGKANQLYEIVEPSDATSPSPVNGEKPPHQPFFRDVSALLNHTHAEEPFDDYARQPLLPKKLSQLGPGVSWADVDGDGLDDIVIASGKGGTLTAFRNDGRGGFQPLNQPPFNQPVTRDQTTVLSWPKAPGQMTLLTGSANYEDGTNDDSCVREYDLKAKMTVNRLPGFESSTGPLALADIDSDGDLDLFVGGRVIGGKFPAPASSAFFRNSGARWELDAVNTKTLANVGLVSGAVFSDLDGDGQPDLVLACEWGPLKIFRNEQGKFTPWNPSITGVALNSQLTTLNQLTGWWNGVATGDFDGDGRMDIVASNWGRNTRYESGRVEPHRIYYGDIGGDGTTAVMEAHYELSLNKIVPSQRLDVLARWLPFLRASFPTHQAFGQAGVEQILGAQFKEARSLEAAWLESTVFLNRGTGFVVRPLPMVAQFAPAFGLCVGDFDGDGFEDIFLAQNFFAVAVEVPRQDAGVGLWLRGDGRGNFSPVSAAESGVQIFGEQRGAALADYDGDGRVDLLVGQNAHPAKLFHNLAAKPGLRIRLAGPPANPQAIGAVLRIGSGPAREVQSGSGYWSQNSAVQVMCAPTPATQLSVRWPGGGVTNLNIRADARDITVSWNGGGKPQ